MTPHRLFLVATISTTAALAVLSASLAFTPLRLLHRHGNDHSKATLFASAITNTRGGGGGDDGGSSINNDPPAVETTTATASSSKLESLLTEAQYYLRDKNADRAFQIDPTSPNVPALFRSYLLCNITTCLNKLSQIIL